MSAASVATLAEFSAVLEAAGYRVASAQLGERIAVLAESPYALVALIEVGSCASLREDVADAQASLTRIAAEVPSARSWDLYLMLHVLSVSNDPADDLLIEEVEADTRYVRKFVRVAVTVDTSDINALDRALRPLLPLRPMPQFDLADPLDALRAELYALDAPADLVDTAIASFQTDMTVSVL
jgi:hypothetical protein